MYMKKMQSFRIYFNLNNQILPMLIKPVYDDQNTPEITKQKNKKT